MMHRQDVNLVGAHKSVNDAIGLENDFPD